MASRAAEARRRIEEMHREARRIAMAEELAGRGQVFRPLRKAPPGSLRALAKLGRGSR